MRIFLITLLLIPLTFLQSIANGRFEFTPAIKETYQLTMSLQLDAARQILDEVKTQDPENSLIHLIENYIDFFTLFLGEEKVLFEELEKNKQQRINAILRSDKDSPYYLYTQAEIRLQWALVRLKFEEYLKAFNEISIAYEKLTKNEKRFPDFMPNKKSLGILHALIGTIPDQFKWGVRLLGGLDGEISQGQKEIREVLDYAQKNDFIFEEETVVMYAFLMLHLQNNGDEAWKILEDAQLSPATNPLHCFVMANIARRTGKNDVSIHLLENRPKGAEFFDFKYLEFMLGDAKLCRLDKDAEQHLKSYALDFGGQNFIKEAFYKLALHRLVHDDQEGFYEYLEACKQKGATVTDEDKLALRFAEKGIPPHTGLLKARFLFDGGYYEQSLTVLDTLSITDLSQEEQLEYHYRKGRNFHLLKAYDQALFYYQQTFKEGQNSPRYFACNAALQMGLIFELQGKQELALQFFEQCLELKPEEYRNGLHQKAKAGVSRMSN